MRRPLACALLGALLAAAASPGADDDPAAVARALAEGRLGPAEAAAAWQRARLDPEEAAALVRRLPLEAAPVTSHQTTLVDGFGVETDAEVVLPADGPQADGTYRAVVLLHGLRGDARQPLPMIPALVPPHTIVIAPSAKMPHAQDEAEDLRASRSVGMDILKRFPHWWSYRERGFPVQALDYLKRRYPIDTDRVVLMGYSMGGFGAWNVGLRYHDLFAAVTPFAGGVSREEFAAGMLGRDKLTRLLLENVAMVPVYFVHGDQDEVVPVEPERWTHEELTERRLVHTYVEIAGGKHVLSSFLAGGDEAVRFRDWLDTRVRRASPRRVVHRSIGDYHPGAYWVRIDARAGVAARVEAEAQRNRVLVTTEGVSRLTLFVDPEVVDVKKNLVVVVDDRPVFQGKVRPSLQAVAESFARTRDPKLVYERMLTLDVTPRGVQQQGPGWGDLMRGGGRR
ncbi:MAG: alpha/beta hydrolase-fold protein [Planctomycetes bacterium]|nr:alpha/beta hydrolase-fold protein [Planctomycetota bacterium]